MSSSSSSSSPSASPPFSIPIHATLESNQAAHGLRHDDYKQYHAYGTRRLSRLRHARPVRRDLVHSATHVPGQKMKRNAYCARTTTWMNPQQQEEETAEPEHTDDTTAENTDLETTVPHHENFLWVLLVGAERAWAHSGEIKASQASLSLSTGFAAQQEKGRSSAGKIRKHALRRLKCAAKLATQLQELAESVGDAQTKEEAKAYAGWMNGNYALEVGDWKSACEDYGTAISICLALSRSSEGADQLEMRDLFMARVDNVLKPLLRYCQYEYREAGGSPPDILEDTPAYQATTSESRASDGGASIYFRGQVVPVENKNLRVLLLKLDALLRSSTSADEEDKFVTLLTTYDDAIAMVNADLKNYESMKAGPAVNAKRAEMQSLLGYVMYAKLQLEMKRSEAMVDRLREESSTSYAEIAHLYDALLQEARVVGTLPGAHQDAEEDEFVLEANANLLRLRAWRCYYAGLLYAESGRSAEAKALWKQALLLASRASEEIAACEDMEHGDDYLAGLEKLTMAIRGALCRAKAQAYLAKTEGSGGGTSSSSRCLLLRLDEFDGGKNLVDVPPATIPLPCKPAFFDVAWNHVSALPVDELQRLINNSKPQESRGLMGWFRSG